MAIISVSLPDKLVRELDKIVEARGYSSRSEAIRYAIESLVAEEDEKEGDGLRVILVLSDHESSPYVDRNIIGLIHGYAEDLKGLYHQIVEGGLCITVAITRGGGDEWRSLARKLRKLRGVVNVAVVRI